MPKKFTEEEIDILKRYYPEHGAKYVAGLLNRTKSSVAHMAIRLKIRQIQVKDKICKYENCDKNARSMGFCADHYAKEKSLGHLYTSTCSIHGCTNIISRPGKQLCEKHYREEYERLNETRLIEKRKKYYAENRDAVLEYSRKYKEENKEKCRLKAKKWVQNNHEKIANKFHSDYIYNLKRAIEIYGNICNRCGSTDIVTFEWHHIKRTSKFENTSTIIRKIAQNNCKLDNIILICSNCHMYENLKSGTGKQGISNLKCFAHDYLPKTIDEKRILKLKIRALEIYECRCQNCCNPDLLVLQWHHRIKMTPREHDKQLFTRIIKNNNKLSDILLLCACCHTEQDLLDNTTTGGSSFAEVAKQVC